jgi:hypothetical protein
MWLIFLLPLAGILISYLYKLLENFDAGNNLISWMRFTNLVVAFPPG